MMTFFTVDGSSKSAQTVSKEPPAGGVERRSAERPWSAPSKASVADEVAAPAPQKKAAVNGNDQEWEEF
jgi:hypothetical protein